MAKKTFWPYGLTIVILLYVGWLLFFVVFSNTQKSDFVENDYYHKGIEYQQQIDRKQRTKELNAKAQVILTPQDKLIIRLPLPADSGAIELYRPANARLDRHYNLHLDETNQQILDAHGLQSGKWIVKINWQKAGQSYYFENVLIVD